MGVVQWEERQHIAVSSKLIGKCQGDNRSRLPQDEFGGQVARTRDEKGRKYRDQ